MRNPILGLGLLSLLAVATSSQAATGTVQMTWDGCTGPIAKTTTTPGLYAIFITVIGHDQPQKAYDVRVIYGDATQNVPDAWRFDAEGCETSAGITQDVTSSVCPPFAQGAAGALQIKKVHFSPPQDPYALSLMQVLLANSYSAVKEVNPATRYFLERIQFDLNAAVVGPGTTDVTCGGMEVPMCFALSYATWLDPAGNEIPFNRSNPSPAVTFNGPILCPWVVPAKATTWGSIKSQYRN